MPEFQTFDLGRAYAQAEQVKGAQQDRELRGLQIAELKKPKKLTFDELMSNQQISHAAFTGVAANPSSAPYWADVLQKAGIVSADFDVSKIPPQQLQAFATRAAQESGSVLAALDPKQYGEKEKELPDWAKDAVVEGVDPRDPAAMGKYHDQWLIDKEKGANDRAKLSAETTTRGQNMAAATARRGQDMTAATAAAKDAAVKTSQPTGEEGTAAYLATRLQGALDKLAEVDAKDPSAAAPGYGEKIAGGLPFIGNETAANYARSETRQQAHTAQLDALDAALTLGTGAAYTKEQLEGYAVSYFPQLNDEPATIADKKQRFATLVAAARAKAGRAAKNIDPAIAAGAAAVAPTLGAVRRYNPATGKIE